MQDQENKEMSNEQDVQAPGADINDGATAGAAAQAGTPGLEEQLSATEAKLAEMHDAFMRAKADGENIRRRAQEDVSKAHKFAIESFAEAMVPVRDSLEMALKVEAPTVESLKEGVEMTLKQLTTAFEKNRLVEVHAGKWATSSIRTSTRPLPWCRRSRKPIPWSPCCKKVT